MTHPPYQYNANEPKPLPVSTVDRLSHSVLYWSCRVLVVPLHPKSGEPCFDLAAVPNDGQMRELGYSYRDEVERQIDAMRQTFIAKVRAAMVTLEGSGPDDMNLPTLVDHVKQMRSGYLDFQRFKETVADILGIAHKFTDPEALRKLRLRVRQAGVLDQVTALVEGAGEEFAPFDYSEGCDERIHDPRRWPVLQRLDQWVHLLETSARDLARFEAVLVRIIEVVEEADEHELEPDSEEAWPSLAKSEALLGRLGEWAEVVAGQERFGARADDYKREGRQEWAQKLYVKLGRPNQREGKFDTFESEVEAEIAKLVHSGGVTTTAKLERQEHEKVAEKLARAESQLNWLRKSHDNLINGIHSKINVDYPGTDSLSDLSFTAEQRVLCKVEAMLAHNRKLKEQQPKTLGDADQRDFVERLERLLPVTLVDGVELTREERVIFAVENLLKYASGRATAYEDLKRDYDQLFEQGAVLQHEEQTKHDAFCQLLENVLPKLPPMDFNTAETMMSETTREDRLFDRVRLVLASRDRLRDSGRVLVDAIDEAHGEEPFVLEGFESFREELNRL